MSPRALLAAHQAPAARGGGVACGASLRNNHALVVSSKGGGVAPFPPPHGGCGRVELAGASELTGCAEILSSQDCRSASTQRRARPLAISPLVSAALQPTADDKMPSNTSTRGGAPQVRSRGAS